MLVDTHAHLHFDERYADQLDAVLARAKTEGVGKIVTVGVNATDSAAAVELAGEYDQVWATVGLHPHEAKEGKAALEAISELVTKPKVVAIGECGLDYFYNHSDKADQEAAFRFQIELAQRHNLPMVWHVRDAFDDFFRIIDDYSNVQGIVHSFTSTRANLDKALEHGFLIALNGIMTFTKDTEQLEAAKAVPLNRLVLETDCPFLTPVPHRGQPNEPAYIKFTAEFLAKLRGESVEQLSAATSYNAVKLLGLDNV
jgi:TatD DNase family protein